MIMKIARKHPLLQTLEYLNFYFPHPFKNGTLAKDCRAEHLWCWGQDVALQAEDFVVHHEYYSKEEWVDEYYDVDA